MTGPVPRGVVFDLDGTLVDSWPLHAACLRAAARSVGLPEPSAARLVAAQRPTETGTVRELVGDDRSAVAIPAYDRAWRDGITRTPPAPLPGALEAIAALRSAGLALGICTGRSRAGARLLMDSAGITLELTVGREDAARPKPAPDGLLRALRLLRLGPEAALYVGDSAADAAQGAAAGVPTVLVGARNGSAGHLAGLGDLVRFVMRGQP